MTAKPLVLASSSPWRRELLLRLVSDFRSIAPDVDELAWHAHAASPTDLAQRLAREKSVAILQRHPDVVSIGSDQLVDLDGVVLGKPGTSDAAVDQLLLMSGKCHRLVTAVCVSCVDRSYEFVNETRLWMRHLAREEAIRYVDRDEPLQCAGSYRIEAGGIGLFDRIDCKDFTAIIGLPLLELSQELRRRGYLIP